jgi:hypothetical protein
VHSTSHEALKRDLTIRARWRGALAFSIPAHRRSRGDRATNRPGAPAETNCVGAAFILAHRDYRGALDRSGDRADPRTLNHDSRDVWMAGERGDANVYAWILRSSAKYARCGDDGRFARSGGSSQAAGCLALPDVAGRSVAEGDTLRPRL